MTTTAPEVSIIMTTYNRVAFIMESVESVLQQTYQNWELIIVDDGSTDNTKEIISRVTDCRVQFYEAGKMGLGIKLKNKGIERSKGELIAFIDSDDLWAPDKLEKQVRVLQNYSGAGFSITGGYNFKKTGQPIEYFYKKRDGMRYDNIFISFFCSEASIFPQTLIFRRQCMPVIHQSIKSSPGSDVEFLLDLAINFKAVILYEPLLYRRLHDNSYSHVNWKKGYDEGIYVINTYKNKKMLPAQIANAALFRLYIDFGENYLVYKKRRKATGMFFKAWANKPFSIVPLKKTGKAVWHFMNNK